MFLGSIIYSFVCLIIIVVIIMDRRSVESTIAWMMLIIMLPVVGIVLFFVIGVNWKKVKLIKQIPEALYGKYLKDVITKQKSYIESLAGSTQNEEDNDIYKNIKLLYNSNNAIVTSHNGYKFYYTGQDFFDQLIEDIKNAENNIHMEYFIWRSDEIGHKIKDVLVEKAKKGVDVRLIFDSFGSLGRISFKYRKELKEAGVKFKYFLDVFQPIAGITRVNYRNHRKLAIIDGNISYTGGMNVGMEYIDGAKRFDSWRDTSVRFTGEVTVLMQALFLTDWFNSGNEMLINDCFFSEYSIDETITPIQIAVSGPDSSWKAIKLLLFNMFTNANKELYIQSPYLVPDTAISEALQIAALSGVEVHLMMTGVPDKRMPFWAAHTYYDELIAAGVHIYQYKKGFLHSKVVVMDSKIATVGTTNMDIRSFKLNYEVNAVIYDEGVCDELVEQFKKDLENCIEITDEYCKSIGFLKRLRNAICRILSPIL